MLTLDLRFSLISFYTFRFCSLHNFSRSKTNHTVNSKLPRETSQCTGFLTNSELNAVSTNLFDFTDFFLSRSSYPGLDNLISEPDSGFQVTAGLFLNPSISSICLIWFLLCCSSVWPGPEGTDSFTCELKGKPSAKPLRGTYLVGARSGASFLELAEKIFASGANQLNQILFLGLEYLLIPSRFAPALNSGTFCFPFSKLSENFIFFEISYI